MGLAIVLCAVICAPAYAQTAPVAATIDIDTAVTTPIQPGFSGVSTDLGLPVEYWDYRFNTLAKTIGFGWVRFPGGTSSDTYNWQTGQIQASWQAQFPPSSAVGSDTTLISLVAGRGGAKLIDAANRANFLGAPLIICVNGYTDSVASAGQLAAFAKANQIQVAAWELSNEPYLYPTFFPTATAYLDQMKPYRDAIKAVDPNAIIAIFVTDQANPNAGQNPWNQAVASYPNQYWDAITYHHYPAQTQSTNFAQWMADENAVLVNRSSAVVTSQLATMGPAGVKFLNTEFDPSIPNDSSSGASSITDGTLWGGIYSAEYIMRMSTVPSVLHVGPSEISYNTGVFLSNGHQGQVEAAAAGTPIDTLSLNFGFYVSAQGRGIAVLNGVINQAVHSNQTTVTGGSTVSATGMAAIPALYAMSYTNAQGEMSVVVTNKSATPQQVTIRVNGAAASGTIPLQFVSATDPSTANTATSQNAISIQSASSANPVTVPPYSVLRADVTIPAVATFVHSATGQQGPAAPKQLVTAFGSGIAADEFAAPGEPLPQILGDTAIEVTDSRGIQRSAPLDFVSPDEAVFVVPSAAATGIATVKITRSGTTVLTGSLSIATVAPGLYSANGNGAGVAIAVAERLPVSGSAAPLTVFSCQVGVPMSCLSTPLAFSAPTDTISLTLFGSGIRGATTVQGFVAGQAVTVVSAAAQSEYQGLDQVTLSIPASFAGKGEASVYVVADGVASNMVTVNFQ